MIETEVHCIIKPTKGFESFNLRELWEWRELFFMLVRKNVSVIYRQTVIGILWVLFQPILTLLVFIFLVGRFGGHIESNGVPYWFLLFSGILLWQGFSKALTLGSASLSSNQSLITKIYLPRLLLPSSSVFSVFLDLIIVALLFILSLLFGDVKISLGGLCFLPIFLFLTLFVALTGSLWFSSVGIFHRDIFILLPFALQIGQFLTPVLYPLSAIPPSIKWLVALNPMASLIELFRWSIFSGYPFPDVIIISISFVSLISFFLGGLLVFFSLSRYASDVI